MRASGWVGSARSRRGRPDRGSATVELVGIAPLLVVLVLFVVWAGRAGQTVEQVRHAADQGARAASLVRRGAMSDAARTAVLADLGANRVRCERPEVSVAVGASSVTVGVRCRVPTSGLRLLHPGARTVSATSTEVIDRYRGGS